MGSGKFSLKMCSNSVKFSTKIGMQYNKLSQKVMFSGWALLMDEVDSSTVSVVINIVLNFQWMRVEN